MSYLQKIINDPPKIESDQDIRYVSFQDDLTEAIANCYYLVWKESFPAKFMYEPEIIYDYYKNRGQVGAFALTPNNEVVGMFCAYQSPFSAKLYEVGGLMVIPSYRGQVDLQILTQLTSEQLEKKNLDAVFCQMVCHNQKSQKVIKRYFPKLCDAGLELKAFAYNDDGSIKKTAYLDAIEVLNRAKKQLFVSDPYKTLIEDLISSLRLDLAVSSGFKAPISGKCVFETFSYEGVLKVQFKSIGVSFLENIRDLEKNEEVSTFQISISLEDNLAPWAIEKLNEKGYFFSSFLPFFDGSYCLLLQKLKSSKPFINIDLNLDESKELFSFIKKDYKRISNQ